LTSGYSAAANQQYKREASGLENENLMISEWFALRLQIRRYNFNFAKIEEW
jgi:hypothetical protein